ncbi:hypothetical protein ILYODFUR_032382 [Ilyodon furcidens]|uniref:Uncharacterized protein n=1 Tax=Ilyodon furcidens TaxID=33524 RepID=A0ABV0SUI7_9TELE
MLQSITTDIGEVKGSLDCLQTTVQQLGGRIAEVETRISNFRKSGKLWNNFRRESIIWLPTVQNYSSTLSVLLTVSFPAGRRKIVKNAMESDVKVTYNPPWSFPLESHSKRSDTSLIQDHI